MAEPAITKLYAVVFMDAIHFNVRQDGQITKKAAYMSVGIDLEGRKDVLGIGSANMNPLSSD
jgi:transposase-like protein